MKQGIIDSCLASGAPIVSPSTIPGKRFRGHPEHHIYLTEMLKCIKESCRPNRVGHPSVPSHHFGGSVEEDRVIENEDGASQVPSRWSRASDDLVMDGIKARRVSERRTSLIHRMESDASVELPTSVHLHRRFISFSPSFQGIAITCE